MTRNATGVNGKTANSSKKPRKNNLLFANELAEDLLYSAYVTLCVYFVLIVMFYGFIRFNSLQDPSQSIDMHELCSIRRHENVNATESFTDLNILIKIVDSVLAKTHSNKYFVCYRSLYELLRLSDAHRFDSTSTSNRIDLCVYETDLNSKNVVDNMVFNLGYNSIEYELQKTVRADSALFDRSKFSYRYNSLLGYYRFTYKSASVYLYVFVNAPATKYSFDSIRRYGLFYLQFAWLLEFLKYDHLINRSVNLWNQFQIYMISEAYVKANVANGYFAVPVDSHDMLMSFYPHFWSSTFFNCTV